MVGDRYYILKYFSTHMSNWVGLAQSISLEGWTSKVWSIFLKYYPLKYLEESAYYNDFKLEFFTYSKQEIPVRLIYSSETKTVHFHGLNLSSKYCNSKEHNQTSKLTKKNFVMKENRETQLQNKLINSKSLIFLNRNLLKGIGWKDITQRKEKWEERLKHMRMEDGLTFGIDATDKII